jgi:hypothetical protein
MMTRMLIGYDDNLGRYSHQESCIKHRLMVADCHCGIGEIFARWVVVIEVNSPDMVHIKPETPADIVAENLFRLSLPLQQAKQDATQHIY